MKYYLPNENEFLLISNFGVPIRIHSLAAKPIFSDEEESEFSPVESQRPSYELPERRQKSKLLYYEPSEQEGKTKNKPLLKEETPDWEKHKQRDEKSPDPKQNIQIGKGRGTGMRIILFHLFVIFI